MKGLINIFKSLPKILLSAGVLVLALVIANSAFAAENTKSQEYYKQQKAASRSDNVYQILKKQETLGQTEFEEQASFRGLSRQGTAQTLAYILEQLRSAANGNGMASVDEDFDDNTKDKGSFTVDDYGKSDALGTKKDNWNEYDNAQVTKDGVSIKEITESRVTDMKQALTDGLNQAIAQGFLTVEEASVIEIEADNLIRTGTSRAIKAAEADGEGHTFIREIQDGSASALSAENSISDGTCPSTEFLRQKYHSGCWSCLVVEKLSSAFLTAAKSAYGLSQRAGITLLWIGVTMWLLMWALKNVSSLAQVEPGNILNELIKFLFKVGLAYWFIVSGLPMVKNYFIGPIMGFGASVAQQFWPERFEGEVENFDWGEWSDEDWKRINEAADKAEAEQDKTLQEEAKGNKGDVIIEGADQISDVNANTVAEAQKNKTGNSTLNGKIPDFSLPGASGTLTSAFGCRPRPKTSCNGKNNRCGGCTGSNYHNGIDIGAPNGTPVYAIGSGKITYATDSTCGHFARITHDGGSGTWVSVYCHMLPKSDNYALTYNRATKQKTGKDVQIDRVAKFQQIGFVGNTGASGGNHLHLGIRYNGANVNPLMLTSGVIQAGNPKTCPNCPTESDRTPTPAGYRRGATKFGSNGIVIGSDLAAGAGGYDLSGSKIYSPEDSSLIIKVEDIKYSGPTDIMPKSVMNSILGATRAITNITAENMILGDAIMCYSTLERGGAWQLVDNWWISIYMTNAFMWIEGFIIFCFGLLLTLAIVYYLMDMSFKVGFAVIALPIVVGLWPFNMTKGKFGMCVSIMAKAAATFAFLALTTTYTVALTEAVINWGDTPEAVAAGEGGIAKLYKVMDESGSIQSKAVDAKNYRNDHEPDLDYAAAKLSLFSTTFVMLLFAFLYSFKLVQNTVPDLVNKFFPDKAFGETNPMHQWATAASRWAKDQAMKPVGYARDIALNQAGNALKGLPGKAVGFAKSMAGKGSGNSKTLAGRGMRGAGSAAKGAGKVAQAAGKGVQGIGKGLSAAGKGLQAIPVVGNVVGGAMMAAGKATEMAGKGVEMAGKGVEKAGDAAKKAGDATDKAYNEFGTRNKKPEGDKDK